MLQQEKKNRDEKSAVSGFPFAAFPSKPLLAAGPRGEELQGFRCSEGGQLSLNHKSQGQLLFQNSRDLKIQGVVPDLIGCSIVAVAVQSGLKT